MEGNIAGLPKSELDSALVQLVFFSQHVKRSPLIFPPSPPPIAPGHRNTRPKVGPIPLHDGQRLADLAEDGPAGVSQGSPLRG